MVFIGTGYRFTMFMYFNSEFSGEENQAQGRYEGNVTEVRFLEVFPLL
jgi:hypothetical protein